MCLREYCMLNGEAHVRDMQWLKECAVRNSSVVFLVVQFISSLLLL